MISAIGATLISTALTSAVTFSDGTMSAADWSTLSRVQSGCCGTVTSTPMPSGGNPGSHWEVHHSLVTSTSSVSIVGVHTYSPAAYSPSVSGAIDSIDFSVDVQFVAGTPTATAGHGIGLTARQGSNIYGATAGATGANANWLTKSRVGITSTDFVLVAGTGSVDFSCTAQPIVFGFYTSNSIGPNGSVTRTATYDNFSVSVNAVVPGTCAGDANGDGVVNFADITTVLGNWLDVNPVCGDANGDGLVNFSDITTVLGNWLNMCP